MNGVRENEDRGREVVGVRAIGTEGGRGGKGVGVGRKGKGEDENGGRGLVVFFTKCANMWMNDAI